ncbi:MAG: hypothetical protein GX427_01800 [Actinomycetales bacterium]|nr:hypothetical protein [Actinomycetales bacterium]
MGPVIARRTPTWLAWFRRPREAVLVLQEDGVLLEGRDLISWADLEAVGEFRTAYGAGLGIRLADPLQWFDEHPGPWRDAASVASLGRMPRQVADILGVREAGSEPPLDRAARVQWARDQTGGWDLTIPDRAVEGGVAAALALIDEHRRRFA